MKIAFLMQDPFLKWSYEHKCIHPQSNCLAEMKPTKKPVHGIPPSSILKSPGNFCLSHVLKIISARGRSTNIFSMAALQTSTCSQQPGQQRPGESSKCNILVFQDLKFLPCSVCKGLKLYCEAVATRINKNWCLIQKRVCHLLMLQLYYKHSNTGIPPKLSYCESNRDVHYTNTVKP